MSTNTNFNGLDLFALAQAVMNRPSSGGGGNGGNGGNAGNSGSGGNAGNSGSGGNTGTVTGTQVYDPNIGAFVTRSAPVAPSNPPPTLSTPLPPLNPQGNGYSGGLGTNLYQQIQLILDNLRANGQQGASSSNIFDILRYLDPRYRGGM